MYLSDEPITEFADDKLRRTKFVNRLAQTISEWNSPDSLVVGVYGSWGSGKSSVLNLLEKILNTRKESNKDKYLPNVVVRFDPWFFNSSEQLLQTFYKKIEGAIKELDVERVKDIKIIFSKYSRKLSFAFSPEFSFGPFKMVVPLGKEQVDETPNQLRQQLKNELAGINGRVIIMIDNLDRLDPPELLLMLKLVRLCSDFPHFTYVLAFDHQQVRNILEEQVNIDVSYLEKIVQVDINLPTIDQEQIDEFLGLGISEIAQLHDVRLEQKFSERYSSVYQGNLKTYLNDLRTSKRYLNAISFSMPLVKGEVNYADFLALEFVRVFVPDVYHEIPKYEKEFTSLDSTYLGGSDNYRKVRFAVFDKFREWLHEDESNSVMVQIIEGVLGFLFPIFGAYISNPNNPMYLPGYLRSEYEREQNIASSTHFQRYFKLRISTKDIPTTTIRQIIETLNVYQPNETIEPFIEIIMGYKRNDQLSQLLKRLIVYKSDIDSNGKVLLSTTITQLGGQFDWIGENIWRSEAQLAANLFMLCSPSNEPDGVKAYVLDFINKTPSLAFANLVVSKVVTRENMEYIPEEINKDEIFDGYRRRIHLDLVENDIDIFTTYPESFMRIISAWRSDEVLNEKDEADKYLFQKFIENERAIGQFLSSFVWREAGTGKPSEFEISKIIEGYDTARIFEIINNQPNDIIRTEIEDYAISKFSQMYETSIQSKEENNA